MKTLTRLQQIVRRGEGGQAAIMIGLVIVVLIGFSALSVDVGALASDKRDLQNAADAMALAGANELPNSNNAIATAEEWATKNGVDAEDIDSITVQPQNLPSVPNPKITVVLRRDHEYHLAPVLGIDSSAVEAKAAAIRTSPGGSSGIVPWSVLQSEVDGTAPGDLVTLKYDSRDAENGDFGGMSIDGTGSNDYRDTIKYGSDSVLCSASAVALGCQETSPECDDAICPTEPGNMTGPTRVGVDYRVNNTSSSCDTFEEAFTANGDGTFQINPLCNPFVDGSLPSLRVVIIPIIDELCNGSCDVTIQGFALFFLEGYDGGKCSGNSCEIKGRFVSADISTGGLIGVFDPDSLMHFTRLVE